MAHLAEAETEEPMTEEIPQDDVLSNEVYTVNPDAGIYDLSQEIGADTVEVTEEGVPIMSSEEVSGFPEPASTGMPESSTSEYPEEYQSPYEPAYSEPASTGDELEDLFADSSPSTETSTGDELEDLFGAEEVTPASTEDKKDDLDELDELFG